MNKKPVVIQPYEGKFSAILLFGPPGSGKGMLGKFLSQSKTQYHLSSGAIFRSLATYSPAGKLYYSYASKNQLLPDEAMVEIWKYFVQGLIATNSYYPESQDLLLEGIPRTVGQAKLLEDFVEVRHIIVLDIEENEELFRRASQQAWEERKEPALDYELHIERLAVYRANEEEILSHYPKRLISRIDAHQKPLEIVRDVLVRLSHVLSKGPKSSF